MPTPSAWRTRCGRSARCDGDGRPTAGAEGQRLNLRRDHVAGGAFVVAGAFVLAVSGDLPFGTLGVAGRRHAADAARSA